jgi:hypothetical protein
MGYADAVRELWALIGKRVRLTVTVRQRVVASFDATVSEPPTDLPLGRVAVEEDDPEWHDTDKIEKVAEQLTMRIVPTAFRGAGHMWPGGPLRISLEHHVDLVIAAVADQPDVVRVELDLGPLLNPRDETT